MVHALEEAWRVLVTHGLMVDVRPLSVDVPLEVVYEGGCEPAGIVDMSPDLKYDIAADRAIEHVVIEGNFNQSSLETFDYIYYWNTYHGMVVDFKERWQDEIIVSKQVLDRVKWLYTQKRPDARLRLPMRMNLGTYIKKNV
jgi:hypothetical protein